MATKQKAETSEVKEEGKKTTAKKSSSTKSTAAKKATTANKSTPKKEEAPAVEEKVEAVPEVEAIPEVEVVGKKVVEVVPEEPKPVEVKEEKKPELKKKEVQKSFQVQVAVPTGSYLFKGPGLQFPKGKLYAKGTKLEVTEVQGNWGKVLGDSWILLNTVNKL